VMGLAVYYNGSLVDSLLLQVCLTNYGLSWHHFAFWLEFAITKETNLF
jgi:hypothetical protein